MIFSSDKKITFTVTGMHCGHCKAACEKAALSVPEVKKAVADYKANSLVVKADKSCGDATIASIIAAVENCGFKAELAK